jgi:DNA-binding XRE family transcriptional regulator
MNRKKKKALEAKGWKVGGVSAFLDLTPEEAAYVELKLVLSRNLQRSRKRKQLTQHQLAKLTKSSQSRIAKMEAGDPSVSIDLLIRSLLVLGATRRHLSRMLASA